VILGRVNGQSGRSGVDRVKKVDTVSLKARKFQVFSERKMSR